MSLIAAKQLRRKAARLNAEAAELEREYRADLFGHYMRHRGTPPLFGRYQHFVPSHYCDSDARVVESINVAAMHNAESVIIDIEPTLYHLEDKGKGTTLVTHWWKAITGTYPKPWGLLGADEKRLMFQLNLDWLCWVVSNTRSYLLRDSELRPDTPIGIWLYWGAWDAEALAYLDKPNPGVAEKVTGIKPGQYPPLWYSIDFAAVDFYSQDLLAASWTGPYYRKAALDPYRDNPVPTHYWINRQGFANSPDWRDKPIPADVLVSVFRLLEDYDPAKIVIADLASDWTTDWDPTFGQQVVQAVTDYVRRG